MTTPSNLTEEYIFAHDLRPASAKIYRASTKALLKHFRTASVEEIDHRAVLTWRKKVLENGLSKRSWNTYSNHLRTVWGYAIEHGLMTHTKINLRIPRHPDTQPTNIRTPVPRSFGQAVGAQRRRFALLV